MSDAALCIFGEVLYDHFPDGKRVLGGAPFNVAWHLQAFGQAPRFVSRVGDDREGAQIRKSMQDWGMQTDDLQTDADLPTGRVSVEFVNGEPQYDIVNPCAYDAIAAVADAPCSLLYHGSLAVRGEQSRHALAGLIDSTDGQVFLDVNLRPPWWDRDTLLALLQTADWVKLNTDELRQLQADAADAQAFLDAHDLLGLILTHGSEGAEVLTSAGEHHKVRPQPADKVVDTVGAGDAFASVFILGLRRGWPLAETLERAQAFASAIVGQRGATVSTADFYAGFAADWQL
jgi:fructokinase